MKEAAPLFEGMHDFFAFADKLPEDKSTKCLVDLCEVSETNERIFIRIKASHFLWKMVRRIAGTLVEIGRGNIENKTIEDLLAKRRSSFNPAEHTAPPSGLFLEKVNY